MRLWKSLLLLSLASTLCFAAQSDRIAGTIDAGQMVTLPGHVSPLAQLRYEQGLIDPSHPLNVTMMFARTAAQQSALQKLLAEQQDAKSANFHKWLTPEQYADRFGLSSNDITKISAWAQSQGLKVRYVARGRDSVTFSGDAAQVQAAFKTEIHNYDVNGRMHFANSTAPMIPAALSGIVGGFRGLHNFFPQPLLKNHPDYTFTVGSNTFTAIAPGDIAEIYHLNPLYQLPTPIDGTNQKLVIVGQTDIYLADINDYRSDFGLSTIPSSSTSCAPSTTAGEVGVITAPCNTTNFQYVVSGTGSDPGLAPGNISESDLDIEVSGSVARNAQIIFVTSSGGVGDSWSWAIDNDLAPVISISYGLCEALAPPPTLTVQDQEFQKGASLGISIFAASGDGGAATCDGAFGNPTAIYGLSVSYPASSPEVTGVGGTEFNEGNNFLTYWAPQPTNSMTNFGVSALSYIPELAWNDTTFLLSVGASPGATGGGPSNCVNFSGTTDVNIGGNQFVTFSNCDAPPGGGFAKPSYQSGVTPSDSVRDVPDISFSASNVNDPYIVCTPQSELSSSSTSSTSSCVSGITTALVTYNSAFGGTSASTPLAAGMAALLNQYLGANGLGNINAQLYQLYGTNPTVFHDINSGISGIGDGDTSDNIVPCSSGTPFFEPLGLRCPSTDSFGYSVAGGHSYSSVTGLGSLDINALFTAWPASRSASSVTISPSATNVNQGASVTFTATVTPATGVGTVSFSNSNNGGSATVLGTASLNVPYPPAISGTAIFTTSTLPGGSNSVTATFVGDSSNNSSTSSATVVTVVAPYTMSASPSSFNIPAGQTATSTLTITPSSGFTGTVNFTNSTASNPGSCTAGLPAGALCGFSQPSVTLNGSTPSMITLTITTAANMALPSVAQAVTVTGSNSTSNETTSVGLTVTMTNQSFTLATTAATFPVTVGQTATVNVTVANPATGGGSPIPFVGATTALNLTYTCGGIPANAEISCQISPPTPTNLTAVTVNLVTTPKTAQIAPLGGTRIFYALLLPGLFGVVFLAGSRRRGVRLLNLIVVLGFSTLWLGACGGGNGNTSQPNPGTPPGAYPLTINATTGAPTGGTALTFSLPITLNVQ